MQSPPGETRVALKKILTNCPLTTRSTIVVKKVFDDSLTDFSLHPAHSSFIAQPVPRLFHSTSHKYAPATVAIIYRGGCSKSFGGVNESEERERETRRAEQKLEYAN